MKKILTLLVSATVVACLVACHAPPAPPQGYQQMYITRDGADFYEFNVIDNGINIVAPPENGLVNNTRAVVWESATPLERDHHICATFDWTPGPTQEGIAVRIAMEHGQLGKAVAVMPNIYGYKSTGYNVQLFDLSQPVGDGRWTPVALSQEFATELQGNELRPRRMCARVSGQTLDFKVWPAHEPEPAWATTSHTRTVTLPSSWVYQGQTGIYIGHLPQGSVLDATNINMDKVQI